MKYFFEMFSNEFSFSKAKLFHSMFVLLIWIFNNPSMAESIEAQEEITEDFFSDLSPSTQVSFFSAYRLNQERFRHARLEARNKIKGGFTDELSLRTDLRMRVDGIYWKSSENVSEKLKKDDSFELDVMNAFFRTDLDFLISEIGIQQIDWTNSLSPNTVDILTPIDIRYGGWGSPEDIIIPVAAIRGYFTKLDLEWLIIPIPQSNRIPKDKNEYGFLENLRKTFGSETRIYEEKIPATLNHIESGIRYKYFAGKFEYHVLYFQNHRRNPSSHISLKANSAIDEITLKYPSQNTIGLGVTYAGENEVLRLYSYYEPNRSANIQIEEIIGSGFSMRLAPQKEKRLHVGLGFDYIIRDDLKLYSDSIFTSSKLVENKNYDLASTMLNRNLNSSEDLFQSSINLEHALYNFLDLKLKSTLLFPYFAYAISPEIEYSRDNWKALFGAHYVTTKNEKSKFEAFKENNQLYTKLSYFF